MPNNSKGERRTLAHSFADAFRGVGDCILTERNMRIHLSTACYVVFFASQLGLTRGEKACLVMAIGAVVAAEIFNTCLEKLCDFTEKNRNRFIRIIKDMAAGAVLVTALCAAFAGILILFRPALWQLLGRIFSAPVSLGLFLLSFGAALVFVFVGPKKIGEYCRRLFGGRT
jgi:diacylglycerol kinase